MNSMINNIGKLPTAANKMSNGNSNIPLRRPPLSRTNSNCSNHSNSSQPSKIPIQNNASAADKWKLKYEEVDQKRKSILIEKEKSK